MDVKFDEKLMNYKLDFSDQLTPYELVLKQVSEAIVFDQEGKVKRALIELGWTPPSE